jgi:hypothetical protein
MLDARDQRMPSASKLVIQGVSNAGALYAIIVFVIGFILGTIRVLLVAPRLVRRLASSSKHR